MSLFASAGDPNTIKQVRSVLEHIGLYVGLAVYTAAGAKIFQVIEYPNELDILTTYQALLISKRELFLRSVWNESRNNANYHEKIAGYLLDYEGVVEEAINNGINVVTQDYHVNWNYIQSVFFSTTILTTIGYGNIAPITFPGRLFCMLFAIVGIPLTLCVIADVGQVFATMISTIWEKNKDRIQPVLDKIMRKKDDDEEVEFGGTKVVYFCLIFLVLFLSFGAFLFTLWEDWTFFDAFYFCFITMTTIGFGDIVPDIKIGEKTAYMLVCTIYILVGMAFTTTFLELARRKYAESWRKMQELRAQIQAQLKLADTLRKLGEHADKNNLELDVDIAGDLAALKQNLAKFKKGKMKGLEDIDINELDWVEQNRKVRAVTIFIYETSL